MSEQQYIIKKYDSSYADEWDQFIENSKNGTFILKRGYADYHSDRFNDHSLLFFDTKQRLAAVVIGNQKNDEFHSHGGLTYGGIITSQKMTTPIMLSLFEVLISYLKENNFKFLHYKTIPPIYHALPADEDIYALFVNGAELVRRDVLSVVAPQSPGPIQQRRKRGVKAAKKNDLTIKESDQWGAYWDVLSETLNRRHDAEPVHTLQEIQLLHERFPNHIKLYVAQDSDNQVVAGTLIYETDNVAHAQYIASSQIGYKTNALDLLFSELIFEVYKDKKYFDFGISNENNGRILNHGLIDQKEGFGARAVAHDYYVLDIQNNEKL